MKHNKHTPLVLRNVRSTFPSQIDTGLKCQRFPQNIANHLQYNFSAPPRHLAVQ